MLKSTLNTRYSCSRKVALEQSCDLELAPSSELPADFDSEPPVLEGLWSHQHLVLLHSSRRGISPEFQLLLCRRQKAFCSRSSCPQYLQHRVSSEPDLKMLCEAPASPPASSHMSGARREAFTSVPKCQRLRERHAGAEPEPGAQRAFGCACCLVRAWKAAPSRCGGGIPCPHFTSSCFPPGFLTPGAFCGLLIGFIASLSAAPYLSLLSRYPKIP